MKRFLMAPVLLAMFGLSAPAQTVVGEITIHKPRLIFRNLPPRQKTIKIEGRWKFGVYNPDLSSQCPGGICPPWRQPPQSPRRSTEPVNGSNARVDPRIIESTVCIFVNSPVPLDGMTKWGGGGVCFGVGRSTDETFIASCWHVCPNEKCSYVVQIPQTGEKIAAQFLGADEAHEVAILSIAGRRRWVPVAAASPQKGERVTQCGYPFWTQCKPPPAQRGGIVIGFSSIYNPTQESIVLGFAANSGDSGSGLYNSNNELCGILWGSNRYAQSMASKVEDLQALIDKHLKRPVPKEPAPKEPAPKEQPTPGCDCKPGKPCNCKPVDLSWLRPVLDRIIERVDRDPKVDLSPLLETVKGLKPADLSPVLDAIRNLKGVDLSPVLEHVRELSGRIPPDSKREILAAIAASGKEAIPAWLIAGGVTGGPLALLAVGLALWRRSRPVVHQLVHRQEDEPLKTIVTQAPPPDQVIRTKEHYTLVEGSNAEAEAYRQAMRLYVDDNPAGKGTVTFIEATKNQILSGKGQ